MIIDVNAKINGYLETAKRSAWNLFDKYNGDERADIQRRLEKLDRQLNKFENTVPELRDDYLVHTLMDRYVAISDECRANNNVSRGGFFARLQKLF